MRAVFHKLIDLRPAEAERYRRRLAELKPEGGLLVENGAKEVSIWWPDIEVDMKDKSSKLGEGAGNETVTAAPNLRTAIPSEATFHLAANTECSPLSGNHFGNPL